MGARWIGAFDLELRRVLSGENDAVDGMAAADIVLHGQFEAFAGDVFAGEPGRLVGLETAGLQNGIVNRVCQHHHRNRRRKLESGGRCYDGCDWNTHDPLSSAAVSDPAEVPGCTNVLVNGRCPCLFTGRRELPIAESGSCIQRATRLSGTRSRCSQDAEWDSGIVVVVVWCSLPPVRSELG